MKEEDYSERLAALREENEFLRQAARSFGELAERLSKELHALRFEVRRNQPRSIVSRRTGTRVPSPPSFR